MYGVLHSASLPNGAYIDLQLFSFFLLDQQMDGGVHRLVVDVTGVSDERDVAFAFVRHEYALKEFLRI